MRRARRRRAETLNGPDANAMRLDEMDRANGGSWFKADDVEPLYFSISATRGGLACRIYIDRRTDGSDGCVDGTVRAEMREKERMCVLDRHTSSVSCLPPALVSPPPGNKRGGSDLDLVSPPPRCPRHGCALRREKHARRASVCQADVPLNPSRLCTRKCFDYWLAC